MDPGEGFLLTAPSTSASSLGEAELTEGDFDGEDAAAEGPRRLWSKTKVGSSTDSLVDDESLSSDLKPLGAETATPAEYSDDASSTYLGLLIAGVLSLFLFAFFNYPQPDTWRDLARPLLFIDTTPSGGDMGAHVWGPAFLRDNLLPQGRLSGWTPDWYAGFPVYHFYMVVPPLVIVIINAGLPWYLGIPLAGAVLFGAYRMTQRAKVAKQVIWIPAVAIAAMFIAVPYGVSFKIVTVIGLVLFPLAAWKMGRLAGSAEPIPTFLALAAFIFIFDTNFTIYGGNIASTLAGEFSFSICLMLSLVAIGMTARGMDTMLARAPTAMLIGLVALCHVLPVFFMIPALVLLLLMHRSVSRLWPLAGSAAMALLPAAFRLGGLTTGLVVVAIFVFVFVIAIALEDAVFQRARWLLVTGPVAMLLSAFWLVPFVGRRDFFNDMGWEPLEHVGPALLTVPMKIALPIAAVGAILSYASRDRIGMMFTGTGALFAVAVANVVGEGPVWNARLLPFYYLSVYMVAAVGIAMIVRLIGSMVSNDMERPDTRILVSGSAVAAVATLIAVAMPLRIMPFGQLSASGDGSYDWLVFSNSARSFVPGWVEWNYTGYEEKDAYREYRGVVQTMTEVGEDPDLGCGRAMWEHHKTLDRYGTPMALMLLPHWTDGCIGSMEGLYFESSASTPFHFLNQSILSDEPSRPQRDLPYQDFDIDRGIAQLQTTGVRYYMAQSDLAIEAARTHPDLVEVAESQPFVVFEVAGSELVQGLTVEPIVVSGLSEEQIAGVEEVNRFEVGWVSQAVTFYNDPNSYPALPAEDGPEEWSRTTSLQATAVTEVEEAEIFNIDIDTNQISFDVDKTGTPVLVKASYFPNWDVSGADGPWRVGPNLMVVVPTDNQVKLSYGRSIIDLLGIGMTLLGILALFALAAFDRGWRDVRNSFVTSSERSSKRSAVRQVAVEPERAETLGHRYDDDGEAPPFRQRADADWIDEEQSDADGLHRDQPAAEPERGEDKIDGDESESSASAELAMEDAVDVEEDL